MSKADWQVSLRQSNRSRSESLARPSNKPRPNVRKRRKDKPEWDGTVSDLNVFKPSPSELKRNHDLHIPKKDHERMYLQKHTEDSSPCIRGKGLEENKENLFNASMATAMNKKRAMIREVFNNQERELRHVLAESDETFSNVKDLFGDNPVKYKGLPNITIAPNSQKDEDKFFAAADPDTMSFYEKLSESVMQRPELNAVDDDEEEEDVYSDVDSTTNHTEQSTNANMRTEQLPTKHFKPQFNIDYYKNIVSRAGEQRPIALHTTSNALLNETPAPAPAADNGSPESWGGISSVQSSDVPEMNSNNNLTEYTNRDHERDDTRDDTRDEREPVKPTPKEKESNSKSTFNDMKKMLDVLEAEISGYEVDTGRKYEQENHMAASSLTGYTAKLISAVTRVTRHLKESELQLAAEMQMRGQLIEAFDEQRELIDALTADLIETQEKNDKLQHDLAKQKIWSEAQIANVKLDVSNLQRQVKQLLTIPSNGQPASDITASNTNESITNEANLQESELTEIIFNNLYQQAGHQRHVVNPGPPRDITQASFKS